MSTSEDGAAAPVHPGPPYDAEQGVVLTAMADLLPPTLTPDMIGAARVSQVSQPVAELIGDRPITVQDRVVPAADGRPDLVVSVLRRRDHTSVGPGVVLLHGGGMIMGDRFLGVQQVLDWVDRFDAVVVTVEYRLAPEHPDPLPVEDCYAGLVWAADHADELGIDPARLLVAGSSAGGGLAAGVALLARDRGGPALAGQVLVYPMLDDRGTSVSSRQYVRVGVWDRGSNETGWGALLGERRGTGAVSIYAAPARASDLAGLPPAYIEVGSAEVFRDEDVAYASRLWEHGVQAELHVWPGSFHGADLLAPTTALARASLQARTAWFARLVGA